MQGVLRAVELVVVINRQVVVQLVVVDAETGLVGPASCHVFDSVATAAQDQQGQVPTFYESYTVAMTIDRGVVRAKLVAC